jgi:hypothetical protein
MALRFSFSLAMNPHWVRGVSVGVLSWRHSMTQECSTLGRVSIARLYRSADVEISGGTSYEIYTII